MKIREDVKQELLKAQESEMETVVLYKYLAERAKDPDMKNAFLKMASDEGKHAGILRKYSVKTVTRKEKPALRFRIMARILGLKMVIRMMLTSEQKNAEAYAPVA